MAYDTNVGNNTLRPRTFFVLYIGPNDNGIGHLIFKLSTKQILITMKYQPVSVPEDLIKAINETDSFINKIQINHFCSDYSIAQDDHSNNNKDNGQTQCNIKDNSKDESYNKLDSSQHLDDTESRTIINQENQILLTMGSSKSTSVSMIIYTGIRRYKYISTRFVYMVYTQSRE